MSKNIKLKIASLEGLAKKVKNENKNKADNLVQLYKNRKISQSTTAEKLIMNFIEYDNLKDRRKKTIDKNYDKIISKYEEAKPLNERMRIGSKYIRSMEIIGEDRAKTEIIYNIKGVRYEREGIKLFINIHNSIYNKLYEDVKRIAEKKLSFKIQTVCQFSYEDGNKGRDNEKYNIENDLVRIEDYDNEDIYASRSFVSSKGADSSLISLDDTLQFQKEEVYQKLISKIDSYSLTRVDKIIIVIYQTRKSRGSSYIPTPPPYNSPKCGLINIKNEDDDKCFYWCMKYHSSKQEKHNDRLTVLKKWKIHIIMKVLIIQPLMMI